MYRFKIYTFKIVKWISDLFIHVSKIHTYIFACQPISPHLNIQKPYSSDLLNKLKMQGLGMEGISSKERKVWSNKLMMMT